MNKLFARFSVSSVVVGLFLASCGGGSSTTPPPPPPPPAAPTFSYAQSAVAFTTEVAIAPLTPTVGGGAITQWQVTPALPAGLTLNAGNGQISGTPTQPSAATPYSIAASNSAGSATFNLTISVNSGMLLDLGHANAIEVLQYRGNRILSRDVRGTWALWNVDTLERLATATDNCPIDCHLSVALNGDTAVIVSDTRLYVRSATDGSALWDVALPAGAWWKLASDGSYVAFGDTTKIIVRSRLGVELFQVAGNYAGARAFAAADELRLALGPAGSSVIQRVAVPAGTSTNSAGFQGIFHSWFQDGSRFLTRFGASTLVFAHDGTSLGSGTLPTDNGLAGAGERVWIRDGLHLKVYSVGATLNEVADFSLPNLAGRTIYSGNSLGIVVGNSTTMGIVDLDPPTPTFSTTSTTAWNAVAYAATAADNVAFGNVDGVILRAPGAAPPQTISRGKLRSLVGSTTRFAMSFASGDVAYYASSGTPQGVIELPPQTGPRAAALPAGKLALSRDGNVLAVGSVSDDGLQSYVTLYSLPSETLLEEFSFNSPDDLDDFSLAPSGDVLSFKTTVQGGSVSTLRIVEVDGTVRYDNASFAGTTPVFSGSGARAAFRLYPLEWNSSSRVIEDDALAGTLPGWVSGWLDEQRLLVARFVLMPAMPFPEIVFDGMQIVDPEGALVTGTALPRIDEFDVMTGNRIYSPQLNEIRDVTTGAAVWSSASTDPVATVRRGTVAGSNVVFTNGTRVRIEPYE